MLGTIWTEVVTRPLTNGLILLYAILGNNFWLAIIVFTVLTRVLMYPLTLKQLRSTRALQELQPRIKAIQERYKNDKPRMNREMMRLYKEAGVNPVGCLGPLVLQLPIFIGLFSALRGALADSPESLVSLSQRLYSWLPLVNESIPLNSKFLWLNLGKADPTPVLPVLVGASMWVTQKMSQVSSADPSQASVNRITTWMLPLLFGLWTFAFPSGLAIYWLVSNVVGIGLQYKIAGWGGLARQPAPVPAPAATASRRERAPRSLPSGAGPKEMPAGPPAGGGGLGGLLKRILTGSQTASTPGEQTEAEKAEDEAPAEAVGKGESHGSAGSDREDRRRGDRKGAAAARGRARRRRGRRRR